MGMNKPVVLVSSHGAAATGFSRIADGIIRHLRSEYDFHQFATNHRSDRVEGLWPIYGNPNEWDAYGLDRLEELRNKIQPDIVLILNDLWFCCMHITRLRNVSLSQKIIAYSPVDGIFTRPELYSAMARFDQVVAYNNFGARELRQIHYQDRPLGSYGISKDIDIIPHGLDTEAFYPMQRDGLTNRTKARRILWGHNSEQDSFIVLNAAKHQLRKRMDLTIRGFSLFAKDKPDDVKLYLHTGATFDGPDLRLLIAQEGIGDRMMISPGWLEDHPAVSDESLNLIYNATDIGINTSMGEGWGLVSFEHAATGAPQIVPAHSACKELWEERVDTLLPITRKTELPGLCMMQEEVDATDIATMLNKLYFDHCFRKEQAQKSFDNANQPAFRWNEVAKSWDALFQQVLSSIKH